MKMLAAGKLRHVVNVMSPTERTDEHGQPTGTDAVYIADVPCSIETLSGREAAIVNSTWPNATYRVEMYADPNRPIAPNDYLTGQSLAERKLHIEHAENVEERGVVYRLLCSEAK